MKHEWHGKSHSPEYKAFINAKTRCNNENTPYYKEYGGRGICFLFTSFNEWYNELGARPSSTHSVDRIDNSKGYEPGNVKWSTKSAQLSNRRNYAGGRKGRGYRMRNGRYGVQFMFMRKIYHGGTYNTKEEATEVYNKKLQQVRQLAGLGD